MTDLFAQLIQRSRGEDVPSPVLPSRFEQSPALAEPWGEVEEFVSGRTEDRASTRSSESRPIGRPPTGEAHRNDAGADRIRRIEVSEDVPAPTRSLPESDTPWAAPAAIAPAVPALDLQAIIAAALRQRDIAVNDDVPVPDRADRDRAEQARDDRAPTAVTAAVMRAADAPFTGQRADVVPERAPVPPSVEVRIGRIEITAAPAPAPRAVPPSRTARPMAAALSLRDYLSRRQRR